MSLPPLAPPSLVLAACLGLVAPSLAEVQDAPGLGTPAQGESEALPEQPTKSLRRILHLRGGTTLRVVARHKDGTWEYKKNGKYKPLPAGAVVGSTLERTVLGELKKRERGLEEEDLHGQALLASWMLEQGLLEEGLGRLEEILQVDPDQRSARTAAVAHRGRFRVPALPAGNGAERWDEILDWSAGRGRVSRELVLHDLSQAEAGDLEGLRERLEGELVRKEYERRSFAAHALRRLYPGEVVQPLMVRAVLDRSPMVRFESAYALREVKDESVAVPIVRALGSQNAAVRTQAAEALGNLGYTAAVAPLITRLAAVQSGGSSSNVPHANIFVGRQFAYVQDFDVEVAQFQAIADPNINVLIEGAVLDAGVVSVEHMVFVREGRAIKNALGKLTGQNPGSRNQDWLKWWDSQQASGE